MLPCPRCKDIVDPEEYRFCPNCGTPLVLPQEPAAQPVVQEEIGTEPSAPQPPKPQEMQPQVRTPEVQRPVEVPQAPQTSPVTPVQQSVPAAPMQPAASAAAGFSLSAARTPANAAAAVLRAARSAAGLRSAAPVSAAGTAGLSAASEPVGSLPAGVLLSARAAQAPGQRPGRHGTGVRGNLACHNALCAAGPLVRRCRSGGYAYLPDCPCRPRRGARHYYRLPEITEKDPWNPFTELCRCSAPHLHYGEHDQPFMRQNLSVFQKIRESFPGTLDTDLRRL